MQQQVPQSDSTQSDRKRSHISTRKKLLYGLIGIGVTSSVLIIAIVIYAMSLIPDTPDIDNFHQVQNAQPSVVVSAAGTELTTFRRMQREWVALDKISPDVIKALIATEDHRFYEHRGIDVGRTVSAIFRTASGDTQGGSTITQQLARNLFPEDIGRSKNLTRKFKEIITAVKIERRYSKQQILETYLNTSPFLYNVFGIEMAARTYFKKSAAALNTLESATLVGMLKGTHYYNPVVNPERAEARRNVVLAQMLKHQHLSDAQYEQLRDRPLQVRFNKQPEQITPSTHFTEHVRKWLIDWAEKNGRDLYSDGLVIHTTLDQTLQEAALDAVARQSQALQNIADVEWARSSSHLISSSPSTYARMRQNIEPFQHFWKARPDLVDAFIRETPEFKKAVDDGATDVEAVATLRRDSRFIAQLRARKTRLEAGFVAIDPATAEVKVWVGSRDFQRDQFDHVAQAERQPGSTFKPIVYGAALEQGFSPNRAYQDSPVTIRSADGSIWRPTDMHAASGRSMAMREGLIHSKNTITAQVMQDVGLSDIVDLAQAVGINQSKLRPVPSLSLGTSPVTLLEMVSAYVTIAQSGEFREPVFVKRITDRDGNLVAEFGKTSSRVMSEDTAVELIDMMRGVVNRGTGQVMKSRFGVVADIAGKTGTTQNNTDGWFILMHPNLVAGAWVGFNDSRVTMRSDYWGQGGHNALLVVGDFYRDVLKEELIDAKAKFPRPKRAPVLMTMRKSYDEWDDQDANSVADETQASASKLIVRRNSDGTTFIGDERGDEMDRRRSTTKTAEELAQIMNGMNRDAATGARVGSAARTGETIPMSGGNGYSDDASPARSEAISDVVPPSIW